MPVIFYYLGRKHQVGARYPAPTRRTIVEPFAGSAAYAHRHLEAVDHVVLVERDPQVAEMWRQILDPTLDVDDLCPPLELGEFTTNRFHVTAAVSGGGQTQAIGGRLKATPVATVNVARLRARMPHDLVRWRDRKVTLIEGDYTEAPDVDATWFVDPPYEGRAGMMYRHGSRDIDYSALAEWCRVRAGQVIVCEGPDATWLPFEPLTEVIGVNGRSGEAVWYGGDPVDHGRLII
jgi:hypothetical protein